MKNNISIKRRISIVLFAVLIGLNIPARASMFGEENALLLKILQQSIQQYLELQRILRTGRDTLGLLQEVNRGLNDSLNLMRTIKPHIDPGLYKDLEQTQIAIRKIQEIYGIVVSSPDTRIQQDTDQQIAEAIALNNSIYQYTNQIDDIGEEVKRYSHSVSPGGAQKLTAQSMGVLLHVMNESLRAQATGLKLQAMEMSIQNKKDKEFTKKTLEITEELKDSMQNGKSNFQIPRF